MARLTFMALSSRAGASGGNSESRNPINGIASAKNHGGNPGSRIADVMRNPAKAGSSVRLSPKCFTLAPSPEIEAVWGDGLEDFGLGIEDFGLRKAIITPRLRKFASPLPFAPEISGACLPVGRRFNFGVFHRPGIPVRLPKGALRAGGNPGSICSRGGAQFR